MNREDFAAIDGWIASVLAALRGANLQTIEQLGGVAALAAAGGEGEGEAKRCVAGWRRRGCAWL